MINKTTIFLTEEETNALMGTGKLLKEIHLKTLESTKTNPVEVDPQTLKIICKLGEIASKISSDETVGVAEDPVEEENLIDTSSDEY